MAEALLPVPIYDQRYASIIDILPTAKHIQSFYEPVSSGRATVTFDQSLEWGFLIQIVNESYFQNDPVFFIYPSLSAEISMGASNSVFHPKTIVISGSSSITFSSLSAGMISGLVVFM